MSGWGNDVAVLALCDHGSKDKMSLFYSPPLFFCGGRKEFIVYVGTFCKICVWLREWVTT